MRSIVFLFVILITGYIYSQDKIEIEKSVKADEVPAKATEELGAILGPNQKVKWFYQEDGNKKVYEAKFHNESNYYSIEFKTDGEIYNVEIGIELNQFSSKQTSNLEDELKTNFESYKIRKIQIEYLGDPEDLFEVISKLEVDDDLTIQYEIEVDAKTADKRALYELVFDRKLNLLTKREIILKSTDILDY